MGETRYVTQILVYRACSVSMPYAEVLSLNLFIPTKIIYIAQFGFILKISMNFCTETVLYNNYKSLKLSKCELKIDLLYVAVQFPPGQFRVSLQPEVVNTSYVSFFRPFFRVNTRVIGGGELDCVAVSLCRR